MATSSSSSSTAAMDGSTGAVTSKPTKPLFTRLYHSFSGSGASDGYTTSTSSSSSASSAASTPATSPETSPNLVPAKRSDEDELDSQHLDLNKLPMCWGHRGASAAFPENTLASFSQAIRDGAEGIESDVHISLDGTIVLFHDAYLNRTTNGKGLITKQRYKDGIDQLWTTKLPAQRICTLVDLLDLLMLPENRLVLLNVDVKLDNEPELLFTLMGQIIETYPEWQTSLAPRLILGLWHAKYITYAQRLLPYCRLAHIGVSPALAKKYFWDACSAFSLNYASLVGKEGESFRRACKEAGKDLYVWTVNDRIEMIQATRWGAKAILTDRTADYLKVRTEMKTDYRTVAKEVPRAHNWLNISYFTPYNQLYSAWHSFTLHRSAGPMLPPPVSSSSRAALDAAVVDAQPPQPASDTSVAA